mgnify:CR=1 FL=1
MTEHTQGPWILHKYPGSVEAKNGLACCGHDAIIANTLGHSCNAPELKAEQEANARLIAAAPDLLGVCNMLIDAAKDFGLFNGDSQDPEWYIDRIQMAINKAKGV